MLYLMQRIKFEYRITLGYLIIGGLWIIFSDLILNSLIKDQVLIAKVQTFKGWFYVAITAILFYLILNKHLVKLRKAEKEAKESDMLKTSFLQNISHEIRTPMNSIIGFSDLLREDNLPENKRKEFLEIISYSSNQLLRIVNDLLDISLIETGNVRVSEDKVHINKMIDEIYLSFKNQIEGDISFILLKELSDDQCLIYTDENKLRQILTNLVNNAIKFTEIGYIKFGYKLKKNILEFFIEDTGIGIPHDMQDKIFNRFLKVDQNVKRLYPGVGLGLSICKGNAEVINGQIRVESSPGKGSVFFVSIPYRQAT